jgi:hypothetical protein
MMKAPRKETTSGAEKIPVNSETEKGIAGRKNKKARKRQYLSQH